MDEQVCFDLSALAVDVSVSLQLTKADVKNELEYIQAFFKDADRRATVKGEISHGIQTYRERRK